MAASVNEDESTQLNNNPTNYESFKEPIVTGMNFIFYAASVYKMTSL
jgi:hypothetical protein